MWLLESCQSVLLAFQNSLRINLTSAGAVAPELGSADDRGAAPNRGRVKPNLPQRAPLRLPAAIQQGPGLPRQGPRKHSWRCREPRHRRAPETSLAHSIAWHGQLLPILPEL